MSTVSICIPCHNQAHFLSEALSSCYMQNYSPIEIIIMDDGSTDQTYLFKIYGIGREGIIYKYFRIDEPSGSGEAFNKAISHATGDIIVLLCADDVFTDKRVIGDIVNIFRTSTDIRHVSRWYHQFIDGDRHPVRAWRGDNVIELANNPSGLAFRRSTIGEHRLTNKMFVEAPTLVNAICNGGWYSILEYDTVAVRVHKSTARSKGYYAKMWTSSPVEEWAKLGWKTNDYTHLIQVANYYTKKAVWDEMVQFIIINPFCVINPIFVFFAITALCTPRSILLWIPDAYRSTWGRLTTREVKRAK